MSRFALFALACALFASVTFTFASPVSLANGELVEKRTTHTGRVHLTSSPPLWRILIIILYNKGTWYNPGLAHLLYLLVNRGINSMLGMGNCGKMDTNSDLVLAISKGLYDSNGGKNCGQVSFHLPSYCYPRWSFSIYRWCSLNSMESWHMAWPWIAVNLVDPMTLVRSLSITQIAWPLNNY